MSITLPNFKHSFICPVPVPVPVPIPGFPYAQVGVCRLSTNREKNLFRCLLCRLRYYNNFHQRSPKRLLTSCVFLSHSKTLLCENKIDKKF